MKLIAEHYAKSWIAVLVALCVIGIFTKISYADKDGIPAILGSMVDGVLSLRQEQENEVFDSYMQYIYPEIYIKDSCEILVGKDVPIQKCFGARDGTGTELVVQIEKVWNADGVRVNPNISANRTFRIEQPGIYWIMLQTKDMQGRERESILRVLVNRV